MLLKLGVRARAERAVERASISWMLGLAAVGIVIGHTLTYRALAPEKSDRDALLAATGHAYWHAAVSVSVVAGLWALATHVVRNVRFTVRQQRADPRPSGFARRLVTLQLIGFLLMETTERVAAAGASVETILNGRTLLLGALVQIAVALMLVCLLEWIGLAARELAQRFAPRRTVPANRDIHWTRSSDRRVVAPVRRADTIRGPPLVTRSPF